MAVLVVHARHATLRYNRLGPELFGETVSINLIMNHFCSSMGVHSGDASLDDAPCRECRHGAGVEPKLIAINLCVVLAKQRRWTSVSGSTF